MTYIKIFISCSANPNCSYVFFAKSSMDTFHYGTSQVLPNEEVETPKVIFKDVFLEIRPDCASYVSCNDRFVFKNNFQNVKRTDELLLIYKLYNFIKYNAYCK